MTAQWAALTPHALLCASLGAAAALCLTPHHHTRARPAAGRTDTQETRMTEQPTTRRVLLDVDRDGWTKELQLNIVTLDQNDQGMGFRLAGPKYNGSSKNLLRVELDERDASEIRTALDAAFPLPSNGDTPATA